MTKTERKDKKKLFSKIFRFTIFFISIVKVVIVLQRSIKKIFFLKNKKKRIEDEIQHVLPYILIIFIYK